MSAFETISSARCFGGVQGVYRHDSAETGTPMRLGIYLPPQAKAGSCPAVYFLSGLTCTEENFITKAGAQRVAAELGLILIAPDTSPRGDAVPDDPAGAYDFGLAAGFYLDATQAPFSANYRMYSYLTKELPALLNATFPIQGDRQSIMGHSMGGHGALTLALRNPGLFRSVSAFSPIVAPCRVPWGRKAFSGYLGDDESLWAAHDSTALLAAGQRWDDCLVDVGTADPFLERELKPELLAKAAEAAGVPLTLRLQEGYDHSYYFIASFIEEHLRWHAQRLR